MKNINNLEFDKSHLILRKYLHYKGTNKNYAHKTLLTDYENYNKAKELLDELLKHSVIFDYEHKIISRAFDFELKNFIMFLNSKYHIKFTEKHLYEN